MTFVHGESHKPDLAVLEANFVDDADFVLSHFAVILIQSGVHAAGLPADDGVFARFGEDKVTKPSTAVNVISVNVSGAEVGEMTKLRGENFLRLQCHVVVGQFDGTLQNKIF